MARDYSNWMPGQDIPREPDFGDWLTSFMGSAPIFSGFWSDADLPFSDSQSFSSLVGDRAAWQDRMNELTRMDEEKAYNKQSTEEYDVFPEPKMTRKPAPPVGRPVASGRRGNEIQSLIDFLNTRGGQA
jgi:hypothetical protein